MDGVDFFKMVIGAGYGVWLIQVVLMSYKALSSNKMSVADVSMLVVRALFVVLLVFVILL